MAISLDSLKQNVKCFLDNFQSFTFEDIDNNIAIMRNDIQLSIKELYVNSRLKQKHPILSFFSDKPIIGKICSKYIESKKHIYVEEFENNPKIEGFIDSSKFVKFLIKEEGSEESKEKDRNYKKTESILKLYLECLLPRKTDSSQNTVKIISKKITINKYYANIQESFRKNKIKEFLQNKSTTKNDIEKILLLFKKSEYGIENTNDDGSVYEKEFLEEQINNLNEILKEQENLPEKDYNLYANILYLKAIIYFNVYRNEKENYIDEAKKLFNAEKFYRNLNFCLKKEDILDFIKENCLKPRTLYKKIKKLNDFSQKYDEEKGDTFYILYNNINNIEKEINKKTPKEVIAGLKFFKGVILELMKPGQDQQLQLNSKIEYNKAIKCYNDIILDNNVSEDKLKKAQIACLTSINIIDKITTKQTKIESNSEVNNIEEDKNPFVKHFNNIIVNFNRLKDNINSLINEEANKVYNIRKIVDINSLYGALSELDDKDAQYECGIYQENLNNQKIAINHFEIASIIGNDKAKFKTIKYYLNNNNIKRKKCIEKGILNSDISYKVCEKIAKIYKKNDEYETAIEFYNKANEKLKDRKNIRKINKMKNIFVKIGNCFSKLCYKFRKSAEKMICEDNIKKEEEKANYYYQQAINSYKKIKLGPNYLFRNFYADYYNNNSILGYMSVLDSLTKNFTEEDLSKKSKSHKKKYKKIFMNLACFYNYGFNTWKYSNYIDCKKALEYYKKAAYLGDINSMWEAGMLLKYGRNLFTSEGKFLVNENKKEAFEYFKKILLSNDNYFKNSAIIEITEIMLTDNEVREQSTNEIFELFDKHLQDQETKFKIAKMLINSHPEEENIKEKAIEIFKDLINNSVNNNTIINIDSNLQLGNIFYEKALININDVYSYKENLEISKNYYMSCLEREKKEEKKQEITEKLEEVIFRLEALECETQMKEIENLVEIKEESETIEIADKLTKSTIPQIKVKAYNFLIDIYSKKEKNEDLEHAKNYCILAKENLQCYYSKEEYIKLEKTLSDINEKLSNTLDKKKETAIISFFKKTFC